MFTVNPVRINTCEWVDAGTDLIYNTEEQRGYQRNHGLHGERIALTSYAAFGEGPDRHKLADCWTASMAAAIESM